MREMRIKDLPLSVRHTFYHDLRAAMYAGVFGGCLFPFIAIVGRKIGATELQIALLVSAPYVANAFSLLWTEDMFGKGRVWYVVWPTAAGRALLFGMFIVVSPFWYTLLIYVYMFVTAIPFPSYAAIMKTNYPDSLRGRLMSFVRVGHAILWIIASAGAGFILDLDTSYYRVVFPVAALFGVLSAFRFRHIRVRGEKKERSGIGGLVQLAAPFRDRSFLRFISAYSLFELGVLVALPVYPLVLVDEMAISNATAGIYGSIFSGAWLVGFFFWGRILDRLSLKRAMVIFFIASSSIPLIYLYSRDTVVIGLAQGAAGIVFAAVELVGYVVITRLCTAAETARFTAVHIAIGGIRGASAPFLGTMLYSSFGPSAVFTLAAALTLGAALFTLAAYNGRGDYRRQAG